MHASTLSKRAGASLADSLGALVHYLVATTGGDFLQAVEDLDLSLSQIKATQLLATELDEPSVKELADRLGLSLPAVSRAVDGLVRRGLVTRTEDSEDRRCKRVAATPEGRDVMHRLMELRLAGLDRFVDSLSARERADLARALEPIVARPELAAVVEKGPSR